MHYILSRLCQPLVDLVAPPRDTELLVRELCEEDLMELVMPNEIGLLPYHDERARALVWEMKYYASSRAANLGGIILAEALIEYASDILGEPLLIPIPLHHTRRRERGHNQSELLCKAALAHAPHCAQYAPQLLVRHKATPHQQGSARHKRLSNLKNSMTAPHPERLRGRTVIIVDDVTTTGATFAEAKRALLAAGAAHVYCLALAQS